MEKTYEFWVYTSGIKEYCIEFDSVDDAESAYVIAETWRDDYRGIYEPYIGDQELYIACTNDTLHDFLRTIENEIGLSERK